MSTDVPLGGDARTARGSGSARPPRRPVSPTRPALRPRPSSRPWWHYLGAALTVVLCLAGAALVGFVVVMWIALSSYGSNK